MRNSNQHLLKLFNYSACTSQELDCGVIEGFDVMYEHCPLTLELKIL